MFFIEDCTIKNFVVLLFKLLRICSEINWKSCVFILIDFLLQRVRRGRRERLFDLSVLLVNYVTIVKQLYHFIYTQYLNILQQRHNHVDQQRHILF